MEHVQDKLYRISIVDTNLYLILKICLSNEIVVIKEVKSSD
ncbi:hypothetical protein [Acinetobacter sp. YH12068_T]